MRSPGNGSGNRNDVFYPTNASSSKQQYLIAQGLHWAIEHKPDKCQGHGEQTEQRDRNEIYGRRRKHDSAKNDNRDWQQAKQEQ